MRRLLLPLLLFSVVAHSQDLPNAEILDSIPALNGNSPVEMIDSGTVLKGNPNYSTTYLGYTYNFATAASKSKFDAHPDMYNIRLDGRCPLTLALGQTAKGNPSLFSLFDHRIFIFKDETAKANFDLEPSRYVARQNGTAAYTSAPAANYSRPAG